MSRRTQLVAPLLALLLSACGTTVSGAQLARATAQDDGLAPSNGQSDPGGLPVQAGEPTSTSNGQVVSSPTTQVTSGPATQVVPTTGPSSVSTRIGGDRKPVRVGVLYLSGADAVAGSVGITGLSTGDAMAQARAVASYLNAHGGLAGHPIDLRDGGMAAASALSNREATYAAACASLVQDQKVTWVVSYVNLTSTQLACYAKAHVTVLDDQSAIVDSAGTTYAATFAGPGELALGRASQELVDALWRRGWLTASSKVGTLVPDSPDGVEVETRYLIPALAKHGLKPAATARPGKTSGANQSGTAVRFRSAGVDRVLPMAQSPLFLMEAAESQGYRPAYAMNSGFGPGALLEGTVPKAQLKNAAGIGWSTFLDIGAGTKPGPVSANETRCFQLMARAGQQSTDATTQAFQASLCNVLMFLKAGMDRYGVMPDLLDRVRQQGLDFAPADAFAIRMRPSRADGVSAYRDVAYVDGCSCFQYVSGNRSTS